jgi:hypothetical protein
MTFGRNGVPDTLINYLSQSNSMIQDMLWKPSNKETSHVFREVAGLPKAHHRSLYEGVVAQRSTQAPREETCSLYEAVSELDKELVNLASNKEMFRAEEATAFIEGMTNDVARDLWYGSRAGDPRNVEGLTERYANLTGPASRQIIDAGGVANDNASIWLVGWGDRSLYGIYPKNTRAGLEHDASGVIDLIDPENHGTFQGYRDRFKWRAGLALLDYRQSGRICNIDVPALATFGTAADTSANLLLLLNRLTNRIHSLSSARFSIYMNRDVKEAYENQLLQKQNLALTIDAATGAITTSYKGIPIKTDDNLLSTEERVV